MSNIRVKEIDVSLGISFEANNTWYKPNSRMVLQLDEDTTPQKRNVIWKKAWEEIRKQLEKEIENIVGE